MKRKPAEAADLVRLEEARRKAEEAAAELRTLSVELAEKDVPAPSSGFRYNAGRFIHTLGNAFKLMLGLIILCVFAALVITAPPTNQEQIAEANQPNKPFDPNQMQNPDRLCRILARVNLASDRWGPSRSEPGGYVCQPLGSSVEIAAAGTTYPTMLNAYIYGSGTKKLDRFTLKLNIFDRTTSDAGKRALLDAANIVATEMNLIVPANVESLVRAQPVRMLRNAQPQRPRTLFRQQIGNIVLHIESQQTNVTSIMMHFRNANESSIWLD